MLFKFWILYRNYTNAAEYKHIILGLIFLKYVSDAFEELFSKLKKGEGEYAGADPEDKDEYKAENVFFVPEITRWSYLQSKAKLPDDEDDFNERFNKLKAEFEEQLKEEAILNALVAENLGKVKQNLSDSEEKSLGKRVVRKGGQKRWSKTHG